MPALTIDREDDEGGSMSDNLKIALNEEGYLCDEKLASAVEACLSTRPTAGAFLFGPAGSGKTFLPESLAKVLGRELIFYQCFPGSREALNVREDYFFL